MKHAFEVFMGGVILVGLMLMAGGLATAIVGLLYENADQVSAFWSSLQIGWKMFWAGIAVIFVSACVAAVAN